MESHVTVDWLVAGSGAGGMTGAVVADQLGGSVLVVESAPVYGGTTAYSGGVAWIPGNHLQSSVGIDDSIDQGYQYMRSLIGDTVKEQRVRAYAERADEMLRFMMQHSHVSYRPIPTYMDYFDEPGAKHGGRSMCAGAFRRSYLGDEAQHMRPSPWQGMGMPFSMTVLESQVLMRMTWRSYLLGAKLLFKYLLDIKARIKGKADDRIAVGEALVAKLRRTLMDRDIPLWLNSPVVELLKENGRVVGAVVDKQGERQIVSVRKGVLMATGGFAKNNAMRQQYHNHPISTDWTAASPGSNGDGIRIGQKIGAALGFMHSVWWSPSYIMPEGKVMALISGKSMPGSIIVNKQGRRFANEAQPYEELVKEQYASNDRGEGAIPCYLVFDANFRKKYVVGHIKPGTVESDRSIPSSYFESGLFSKAESLAGLAAIIGVDSDQLEKTVETFNGNARQGIDPDFGRGESLHDRYYADAKVSPNPSLAPLERAPYYALRLEPGDLDTKGGLVCDEHGRVCDEAGDVIAGLYATGNTSAAVMGDTYPGAGATIGSAMTFGYIAAQHAFSASDE